MERLSIFAAHRDGILESAARVCFERASKWCDEQDFANQRQDFEQAGVFKIRRNEADQCRFAIRQLKATHPVQSNERDILKNVVLLLQILADNSSRPEYQHGRQIFEAVYRGIDPSWPFPIQPCTPPFKPEKPSDDSKKVA